MFHPEEVGQNPHLLGSIIGMRWQTTDLGYGIPTAQVLPVYLTCPLQLKAFPSSVPPSIIKEQYPSPGLRLLNCIRLYVSEFHG